MGTALTEPTTDPWGKHRLGDGAGDAARGKVVRVRGEERRWVRLNTDEQYLGGVGAPPVGVVEGGRLRGGRGGAEPRKH